MVHKTRVVLTSLGIALCVLLMLFLLSIYRGVDYGSVEYVRANDAELWVLQEHATNILRTTSMLPAILPDRIEKMEGVLSARPVGFLLAAAETGKGKASLYLTGFDPVSGKGGPPVIIDGRNVKGYGEIVLDAAFASKYGFACGDSVTIKKERLFVCGISDGSNMFVIQYAFISLEQLWEIMGIKGIISCVQVTTNPDADAAEIAEEISENFNDVAVYDRQTFIENNRQEMQSGLLPMLFLVAIIAAVVLTAILSLILSVNILEQRNDYAILKALGSPAGYVHGLIHLQSILLSFSGFILGFLLFFPLNLLVKAVSPEVSAIATPLHILVCALGIMVISLFSSLVPSRKIAHIYPLEVFSQSS